MENLQVNLPKAAMQNILKTKVVKYGITTTRTLTTSNRFMAMRSTLQDTTRNKVRYKKNLVKILITQTSLPHTSLSQQLHTYIDLSRQALSSCVGAHCQSGALTLKLSANVSSQIFGIFTDGPDHWFSRFG